MMMGTLNYMAPEQVRGERTDHRADIFSFGVVLYEMLSGRKAFQGDSFATTLYKILQDVPEPLHNIDATLPAELVWLVEKTLAKPRDERYQDLTDVARDLAIIRQHLSGPEGTTVPVTAAAPARPPSDPPSPRLRRTPSDVHPTSDRLESDSARARAGSGSRPRSNPSGRLASDAETIAHVASDLPPARRSRMVVTIRLTITVVAVAAVGAASWYALSKSPEREAPQTGQTVAQPAANPLPPPPVPEPSAVDSGGPTAQAPPEQPIAEQRRTADEARSRMLRAKTAARAAGPAATSSASYAAAAEAEREANRLYKARELREATAKFNEASGLFRGAELTPPPVAPGRSQPTQPSSPRPQPEPATPRTETPASPPPAAPPQTTTPAIPTAEKPVQLPSSSAPRLPPPPAPAPKQAEAPITAAEGASSPPAENGVRDLLRRYEQALEARNLEGIRRVWPTLSGGQEDALRREFQQTRRIEVDIDDPQISITGATGTVIFVRRYHLTTVDGQRLDRNSRTTMSVRRAGSDWVIDRVHFEAIR
jgi:serine/threonine-protein kinase